MTAVRQPDFGVCFERSYGLIDGQLEAMYPFVLSLNLRHQMHTLQSQQS